jgi:hypothetical protein
MRADYLDPGRRFGASAPQRSRAAAHPRQGTPSQEFEGPQDRERSLPAISRRKSVEGPMWSAMAWQLQLPNA